MACVDVTPEMCDLLEALHQWPVADDVLARLRESPDWHQALRWGWIMRSGELTGTGLSHVHSLPDGILKD